MPSRILKESICTSDTINRLSYEEETFFYRLIVNCDDYGCMDGRLQILRAKCYPLRITEITDDILNAWLTKLQCVGLVKVYHHEEMPYIFLPTWGNHQQIRAKRRKYPEPPSNGQSSDNIGNHLQSSEIVCTRNPNQSISSQSESESNQLSGLSIRKKGKKIKI